jgi:hypothetical protein
MATPSLVLLFGGGFQDALGEVIAKGTLRLKLSQDEVLSNNAGQLCGGAEVRIPLDANGNVDTAQANVSVWPTDQMMPAGAFYTVWAYAADGQLAWGPNSNLTVPSGATYNLDGWVPNLYANNVILQVGSITLQTDGVNNSNQFLENLVAGSNIVLLNSAGATTISATVTQITLKTNGSNNANQSVENLVAGSNITLTNGSGGTTISATITGGSPGTPSGTVQYNNSGAFAGIPNSSVDGYGNVILIANNNSGSEGTLAVVGESGQNQPVAQFYSSNGTPGGTGELLLALYQSATSAFNRIYAYAGIVINGYLQDSAGDGSYGEPNQVLTSTGTQVLWQNVSVIPPAINNQGGGLYTAALSDAQNIVNMTDGSPCMFQIPATATVAFPIGTILTVIQAGGQVTVTPAAGVTLHTPSSFTSRTPYSTISITETAANTWVMGGDLT